MKVYISGAITNNPDYLNQFGYAAAKLTAEGHAVLNPCKNEGFTYREYINMGLCELMHCDAIYMLSGWESSKGAKLEYGYAVAVGLEVMGCKPADSIQPESLEFTDEDRAIIENFVTKTDDSFLHMREMQAIVRMGYEICRRGERW